MGSPVKKIIHEALQMPPEDRAAIAEELISSLDQDHDLDVEVAWQREVQKRVREIEGGSVSTIPWEKVRQRLRQGAGASD